MGLKDWAAKHANDAEFEGVRINGDLLVKGLRSWPVAQCDAQVDHGANIASRITATRVVTGAVLLGPLGAVLGGLAKKNRSKVYLAVTVPDDLILVELKAKHEAKARVFANKVQQAAKEHQPQE